MCYQVKRYFLERSKSNKIECVLSGYVSKGVLFRRDLNFARTKCGKKGEDIFERKKCLTILATFSLW
jgi:hypothetical protein